MKSIRERILWRVLAGATVLLAAGCVVLVVSIHERMVHEFDYALETQARAVASMTERVGSEVEIDLMQTGFRSSLVDREISFLQVRLPDGTTLYRSETLEGNDLPMPDTAAAAGFANVALPGSKRGRIVQLPFIPRAEAEEEEDMAEEDEEPDEYEIVFQLPGSVDPESLSLVITVARHRTRLDQLLAGLYGALGMVTVAVLAGIALLVQWSLRSGFAPVTELNNQIRAIDPESLDARLDIANPPAELGGSISAINGLLDRLQGAFLRQRRFTSDVAHELRTPVSELRTASEVGRMCLNNPDDVATYLDDVCDIAVQMDRIVGNLLELGRCHNKISTVTPEMVTIAPLVTDCWHRVPAGSAVPYLEFEARIDPEAAVKTDRAKLTMILQNVIDNAASYSEPGSTVVCRGEQNGEGFVLSVENQAQNAAPEDLQNFFEPFWRKDPGRSHGHHSGLGLPLAKALAELLGARIDIDVQRGSLFKLSLVFPTASA